MPEFTAQGVANSAWAWAVLDYWPDSELIDLYKEKIKSLDRQQISKLDYVQLFQASYAFEQFSPHGADGGRVTGHVPGGVGADIVRRVTSARCIRT